MKKRILLAAFAALALAALPTGAMADAACTVTVTKFHQSYPYSGKATVEYTVGGAIPAGAVVEITIRTDDASATFTQNNVVAGANTNVIDFASSFGGALVLTNASFVVTIAAEAGAGLGGVQLWEGGPYWAECNVGATEPEEYGYYFWWGDTVGYERQGNAWVAADGSSSDFSFSSGNTPTYDKDNSALRTAGYIDATGNLTAAHDAATAHLGAPWRMPTSAEIDALLSNCTTTWITRNGVNGRLVTGKGAYADRSIFLPAAGYGYDSDLNFPGSYGRYWSSSPNSDDSYSLRFLSSSFYRDDNSPRRLGQSVRPVRGFAE